MKEIILIILVLVGFFFVVSKLYSADKTHLSLQTEDGQTIAFRHHERGYDTVIVLAHGFYNNKDVYLFQKIADVFKPEHDVLTFDFRGHGKSDGLYTWTAEEAKDLRAIVAYAKEKGYRKIGVIGFSLGAAVTLIEASENRDIHSIIAVSSPSDFWKIDYRFWKREMFSDLKLNIGPKGRGKSVRPGNPFRDKIAPIEIVDKVAPTPILFLHGEKDWLIKPQHSRVLFEKALQPKKLYIIHNVGHAEKIYDDVPDSFKAVCLEWFAETLA